MKNIIRVAVLGSTGYVGSELVRILSLHKKVRITFLGSEKKDSSILKKIYKNSKYKLPTLDYNKNFHSEICDLVFLSLPHGISNVYVKKFFNKIKIIDLSADFRLDLSNDYKKNYNSKHICLKLLKDFTYGLAEINFKKIQNSNNIAVPGCYPTSILLPMIPLLKKNLIKSQNIIIDSKSGYSGAGKNFDIKNIKNKDSLNFYNYNTNEHRHISEIKQELQKSTDEKIFFSFNPHILPIYRGMISTIYCDLKYKLTLKDIINELNNFYKNSFFVKIVKKNQKLDFFTIQNTNFCLIKILHYKEENKIIIISAIDNLLKGAAGQAIQCFNILNKFKESEGLKK